MKNIKIIVEKYSDGYIAYPLSIQGVVVGKGDNFEEALNNVRSAISCHIETFGESDISRDDFIAAYKQM